MVFFKRFFHSPSGAAFRVSLAALLALFFVNPVFPDQIPLFKLPQDALYGGLGGPDDSLPAKTDLRTGTLANGLRYYILENALPAGRAYLTLAVNAGSTMENDDERGLAHFVEHMAFSGTRRFPGTELVNYLRSLGMRFGPEVNAYTSFDETVYRIETPVESGEDGIKRIPARALAILDDWTWAITFSPGDVDKERAVILEEYRTRLGAMERVRRQLLPVIFRGSRYADRNPIGLPEILQNAQAEQLEGFYRSWYRPENMAIILVGDFDGAVLEKELTAHFTAPAPGTPFSRPYFELPDPRKGAVTATVITDEELPHSTVYLYYKRSPQALSGTLSHYRQRLIDYLIETMTDFRYGEKIAAENTPYTDAGAWSSRFGRQSRYYIMAANTKAGRSGETLRALLLEKESLLRYGFTQSELNRAKAALLSNFEMTAAEANRRDSEEYIRELTADYLGELFALDPEWELEAALRLLPAIGLGTVNSAVKNYYDGDDITVLIAAAPSKSFPTEAETEELPNEQAIIAMVEESRNAEIAPPRERAASAGPVSDTVRPGTVVSVLSDESGAEIWELSNGMRLILLETANKNNELDLYALARGGTVGAVGQAGTDGTAGTQGILDDLDFSVEEALNSVKLVAELQGASGLGSLSKPELMDFLSDKQVSLSFWMGFHTRGLRGSSTVRDLPTLFQMLHASFAEPRIDQTGFIQVLDYHKTQLLLEADSPEAVFYKEFNRVIYGDHPAFMSPELEDLEQVSEKAALTFLTLALNPADYTLVLAGSLGDRAALRNITETWLASIQNRDLPQWNTWVDPEVRRPGKTERIIRKGKEEKSIVYMGWFVPKTWTEADNAAVLSLNEYLDIVLNDEIREKLGGVYSIYARTSLSPMPIGELSLEIYFICDPKREAELRQAVKDQLTSLAAAVDGETLSRSIEALVKNFERSMENNGFVARNLANFSVVTGAPLVHLIQRPDLYRSVTAEQIRSFMPELLAGGPVEVVLLPETADN